MVKRAAWLVILFLHLIWINVHTGKIDVIQLIFSNILLGIEGAKSCRQILIMYFPHTYSKSIYADSNFTELSAEVSFQHVQSIFKSVHVCINLRKKLTASLVEVGVLEHTNDKSSRDDDGCIAKKIPWKIHDPVVTGRSFTDSFFGARFVIILSNSHGFLSYHLNTVYCQRK